MLKALLANVPDTKSIWSVFASIVGMTYSWSVLASFYMLPSWLFFLEPAEVVRIYALTFFIDFIESLLLLVLVLVLELMVLRAAFGERCFRSRSLVLVLVLSGSAVLRLVLFSSDMQLDDFLQGELGWWATTGLLAISSMWAVSRVSILRSLLEGLSDRANVFLLIYLPLTLLSLAVLTLRVFQ